MKEQTLNARLAQTVVGTHFLTLLCLLIYFLKGGFTFDEFRSTMALVLPMFAVFTTMAVRQTLDSLHSADSSVCVKGADATTLLVFPVCFLVLLLASIVAYGEARVFSSFGEFTWTLTAIESGFGVFVGQIVKKMWLEPKLA